MRDLEELRARLSVALALGLGACGGEERTAPEQAQPAASASSEAPSGTKAGAAEPDESEPPQTQAQGPGGGVGRLVEKIRTEDQQQEAEPSAETGAALTEEQYAGMCHFSLVSVADADSRRVGSDDAVGCPSTISAEFPGMIPTANLDEFSTRRMRESGDTAYCCYREPPRKPHPPRRGRPFVDAGQPWQPAFALGPATPRRESLEPRVARRVAAGWLRDARAEWASVASFERAAQELLRRDAPRSLIERYRAAADDERRHAAACRAWAAAFSGRAIELGRLPEVTPRPGDLAACLRWTFAEGCMAETSAALVARRSARHARPDIAATLRMIAEDEAEHAALAWATVGWGLPRLSPTERATFLAWARAQRPGLVPEATTSEGLGPDARYGRMSRAAERAQEFEAWRGCIEPLLASLAAETHAVVRASPLGVA